MAPATGARKSPSMPKIHEVAYDVSEPVDR
jgi:hypothetical protein